MYVSLCMCVCVYVYLSTCKLQMLNEDFMGLLSDNIQGYHERIITLYFTYSVTVKLLLKHFFFNVLSTDKILR